MKQELRNIMNKLPKEKRQAFAKKIEEAQQSIERATLRGGNYTHNIIGLVLNGIAKEYGNEAANYLVREHDLTDYGFREVHK